MYIYTVCNIRRFWFLWKIKIFGFICNFNGSLNNIIRHIIQLHTTYSISCIHCLFYIVIVLQQLIKSKIFVQLNIIKIVYLMQKTPKIKHIYTFQLSFYTPAVLYLYSSVYSTF